MKALVLCGGFGIKLKEVIHDRPKVMAPIGGRPFLEFVIENLRASGIDELVLSIGYLGDFVRDYFGNGKNFGVNISYSEEHRPLGTGGAVLLARKFFTHEPFFVINGDTYLATDYRKVWDFHLRQSAKATVCVVQRRLAGLSGLVALAPNSRVKSFLAGASSKKNGWENCGVYVLTPNAVSVVKNKNRFSLEKDVFTKLAQNGSLYGFKVQEDFIDIGTPESYTAAKKKFLAKKQKVVEVRVPTRVSFAGGGSDLPEYFLKHNGIVVGGAINKFAHVRLITTDSPSIKIKLTDLSREEVYPIGKFLPYDNSIFDLYKGIINKYKLDFGCEVTVWGDFSAGSGLGSSSAIACALILAISKIRGRRLMGEQLARAAIDLERVELSIPGGWQDQYLCALGGLNCIKFLAGGKVKVRHLKLSPSSRRKLEDRLLLFYLGGIRSERGQQSALVGQIARSEETLRALSELKELAGEVLQKLEGGEFDGFGKLLDLAWQLKKKSSAKISNVFVDKIYKLAMTKGAYGGKLLGSGGGGYLLLYCPQKARTAVVASMRRHGLAAESLIFDMEGAKVMSYEG